MYVYVVEKVVEEEYGGMEVQAVFESEAKAQAYIEKRIIDQKEWDPDFTGRFYPWYDDHEEGLPIYTIEKCEVR